MFKKIKEFLFGKKHYQVDLAVPYGEKDDADKAPYKIEAPVVEAEKPAEKPAAKRAPAKKSSAPKKPRAPRKTAAPKKTANRQAPAKKATKAK